MLLSLLAALCFGSALVLTQIGLRTRTPLAGARISIPTSAAIFSALAPFVIDFAQWNGRSVILFALAGLLFPAAVTLLTFEANRRIGPNLTGALGNLTPLFAVLIASAVLGERPTAPQIAGMVLIAAGVALLFYDPRAPARSLTAVAVALPVVAALIRGLVQPVVKLGLETWPDPFAASLIGYLVSTCVVTTAGALATRSATAAPPGSGRLCFMAVGLCNGSALLCVYAALARGSVTTVAPLVACYPLVTLAIGRVLLGAAGALSRWMMLGVAVTVGGVLLLLAG